MYDEVKGEVFSQDGAQPPSIIPALRLDDLAGAGGPTPTTASSGRAGGDRKFAERADLNATGTRKRREKKVKN